MQPKNSLLLTDFPSEILLAIIHYLPDDALLNLRKVNQELYELITPYFIDKAMKSIQASDYSTLHELLYKGMPVNIIVDNKSNTLLHIACALSNNTEKIELISLLIRNGANTHIVNSEKKKPEINLANLLAHYDTEIATVKELASAQMSALQARIARRGHGVANWVAGSMMPTFIIMFISFMLVLLNQFPPPYDKPDYVQQKRAGITAGVSSSFFLTALLWIIGCAVKQKISNYFAARKIRNINTELENKIIGIKNELSTMIAKQQNPAKANVVINIDSPVLLTQTSSNLFPSLNQRQRECRIQIEEATEQTPLMGNGS